MAEPSRGQQSDDVATFFSLARDPDAALAPDDRVIDLLKRIAITGASVVRFRRELAAVNDSEREAIIREVIAQVAISLDHGANGGDGWAELFDRYAAPAAGGTVVAGIVAFATGAMAAPIMLGVGMGGLAITGAARFFVKSTANSDRKMGKMIARLLEKS